MVYRYRSVHDRDSNLGNINPPSIPTVRDRLYTIEYNETELRYDPDLPKRVPYPKNQQQVVELYHRALKTIMKMIIMPYFLFQNWLHRF